MLFLRQYFTTVPTLPSPSPPIPLLHLPRRNLTSSASLPRLTLLPLSTHKARSKDPSADFVLEESSSSSEEEEPKEGVYEDDEEDDDERDGYYARDEVDHDRDPELAELLGSFFDDPKNAQTRVEERIRKKRDKVVQPKSGSATPMEVVFNKFNFSNSYIWFEFYNAPLPNDISLICNTIRSWHIIGRLGGCNSMNMQLSEAPLNNKRPSYDAIQGANITPTTFYNIGDLEIQDNLARIWVDIGTSEPLLLDVLINALVNVNSDYVGIKQLVFGGTEFKSWRENLTPEDAGYSVHRI